MQCKRMARQGKRAGKRSQPIIRREEAAAAGHHGGAWKVAYADFVTAMMAFFLVMWLLNATTEDQRKGLADYFSPNNLMSHASSGSGQPFGGHTAFDHGAMVSDRGSVQVLPGRAADPPRPRRRSRRVGGRRTQRRSRAQGRTRRRGGRARAAVRAGAGTRQAGSRPPPSIKAAESAAKSAAEAGGGAAPARARGGARSGRRWPAIPRSRRWPGRSRWT